MSEKIPRLVQLHRDGTVTVTLRPDEVDAYDETMLQLQMEQASNDSIDSGAYEFREHDCDLMGIPATTNRVVDEEAYQRHLQNAPYVSHHREWTCFVVVMVGHVFVRYHNQWIQKIEKGPKERDFACE